MKLTNQRLRNIICRSAVTYPLATVNDISARQLARAQYYLNVFNAPRATQYVVKDAAAASNQKGRNLLAIVLDATYHFDSRDWDQFLRSFKRHAAISVSGPKLIAAKNSWSWGPGKRRGL